MVITPTQTEPRIDSRLLARHFGKRHQSLFELLKDHRADFEDLGKVRFETGASPGKTGQKERFALLNEDQCYLLLAYSRNTARVRQLKVRLVKAFREARRAADVHRLEYLPSYHQLHDGIKVAAGGSPNERFLHMNANKVINQLAGVQPGQRQTAGPLQQSLLAIGCALAAKGLQTRNGEKVHECIKTAVKPLAGLLELDQKEGS
jgi:phage regulator Rha-like protein